MELINITAAVVVVVSEVDQRLVRAELAAAEMVALTVARSQILELLA
jgi:hypothetical protein